MPLGGQVGIITASLPTTFLAARAVTYPAAENSQVRRGGVAAPASLKHLLPFVLLCLCRRRSARISSQGRDRGRRQRCVFKKRCRSGEEHFLAAEEMLRIDLFLYRVIFFPLLHEVMECVLGQ